MTICLHCGRKTSNPKFCSRSCSVTHNNKLSPKRSVEGVCVVCESPCSTQSKYCSKSCKSLAITARRRTDEEIRVANVKAVIEWRRRVKAKAVSYKGGSCQVCGYDVCHRSMEFHHLDPSKKDFGISSGDTRAWDKVVVELDKCILVCSNCHGEIHDDLIDLSGFGDGGEGGTRTRIVT